MKIYFASALLLLSSSVYAAYVGPNFVKEIRSGFTLPEFTSSETCEIFKDRVVMSRVLGQELEFKTTETRTIKTQANVSAILTQIVSTPILMENGPVDGPSVSYTGYLVTSPSGLVRKVVLHAENGGTGVIQSRDSGKARTTRQYIDLLCR